MNDPSGGAQPPIQSPEQQQEPEGKHLPKGAHVITGWPIVIIGTYLILVFLWLIFELVEFWPIEIADPQNPGGPKIWHSEVKIIGFGLMEIPHESRMLWIVLLSGSLGGMLHALQSFAGFVGSRRFVSSWLWWYILRPAVGAGLALFFYLALRGGLMATQAGVTDLSLFGFAAVGSLAGLFSEQATAKLKEIFDTLFKTEDSRPDRLNNAKEGSNKTKE